MLNLQKENIERILTEQTGKSVTIKSQRSIGGGCINHAQKLETTAGAFFIKTNDASRHPGMFEAEAKGLALLRSCLKIAKYTI